MFRDPFERLYSAYANSITNRFIQLRHCKNSAMCTFEEWVNEMDADPTHFFGNEHFMQQEQIAQFDSMHYHHILRLSSSADQTLLWNKLLHVAAEVKNRSVRKSKVMEMYQSLNRSTMEQIASMYEQDVQLWEHVLCHGTPRERNEYTIFDFFKQQEAKP